MGEVSETSILNKHLDEIIYFFESTDYDLVVIEDLDRFGTPEIFIKLREINKIINDRRAGKSTIKFLYAVKDDMFDNKSRAKFFDFIIPVVPVINSSNSLDKFLERLKINEYDNSIDKQFLKEMSLHIDDLRLIHNIINEFIVYEANLTSASLDRTKLLAMMAYKNFYPCDFENLHHGKGVLFSIVNRRQAMITTLQSKLDKDIENVKGEIASIKGEVLSSGTDLVKLFLWHVTKELHGNINFVGVHIGSEVVEHSQLLIWDNFSKLFSVNSIEVSIHDPNSNRINRRTLNKSFSDLQQEITPNATFSERKKRIDLKYKDGIKRLEFKIESIKKERISIVFMPFSELIDKLKEPLERICIEQELEDFKLLTYLLKNGHINENYHLYTSTFHEGRLSLNDRDFLIAIRDQKIPGPLFKIDYAYEVCNEMRAEDFEHKCALNIYLVDDILTGSDSLSERRISKIINYIAGNFEKCSDFFYAYFSQGKNVAEFYSRLSLLWPGYALAAIENDNSAEHISRIIAHVDPIDIKQDMEENHLISDYISEHIEEIFFNNYVIIDDYTALKVFGVKAPNLYDISIASNTAIFENFLNYVHENSLYKINAANIKLILEHHPVGADDKFIDADRSNYTAIRQNGSQFLNDYIEKNINEYVDSVMLALPDNADESAECILEIINNDGLPEDKKELIIEKQSCVLPSFEDIPASLWGSFLVFNKVEINWENIAEYFESDVFDENVLIDVFATPKSVDILSKVKISKELLGGELSLKLSRFIINNDASRTDWYEKMCAAIPYTFNNFPTDISDDKLPRLVKNKVVKLNKDSFEFTSNKLELRVCLIIDGLDEYFKNKESYILSDEVKERLIFSGIKEEYQIKFASDLSYNAVTESQRLRDFIAEELKRPNVDISSFEQDVIGLCITKASDIKTSILILLKVVASLEKDEVLALLRELQSPYCDIATNGKRPRLPDTNENRELANLLKENNIISSFNDDTGVIKINTFNA
jgi:hypothetical protein